LFPRASHPGMTEHGFVHDIKPRTAALERKSEPRRDEMGRAAGKISSPDKNPV
jgi:hypothetical protein